MSIVHSAVSDMLITVKSREIQRGMMAESRGDRCNAARHYLAAAHLELVLADDYAQDGQVEMVLRSRLSAASCLWRAGQVDEARQLLTDLLRESPECASDIQEVLADLEQNSPA